MQQRPDESGMMGTHPGVNSFMDETDEYMDYMGGGGSPLGLSSESSNQDRSCSSTPGGNDGSPAGENMFFKKSKGLKGEYNVTCSITRHTTSPHSSSAPRKPATCHFILQSCILWFSSLTINNRMTHRVWYSGHEGDDGAVFLCSESWTRSFAVCLLILITLPFRTSVVWVIALYVAYYIFLWLQRSSPSLYVSFSTFRSLNCGRKGKEKQSPFPQTDWTHEFFSAYFSSLWFSHFSSWDQ